MPLPLIPIGAAIVKGAKALGAKAAGARALGAKTTIGTTASKTGAGTKAMNTATLAPTPGTGGVNAGQEDKWIEAAKRASASWQGWSR